MSMLSLTDRQRTDSGARLQQHQQLLDCVCVLIKTGEKKLDRETRRPFQPDVSFYHIVVSRRANSKFCLHSYQIFNIRYGGGQGLNCDYMSVEVSPSTVLTVRQPRATCNSRHQQKYSDKISKIQLLVWVIKKLLALTSVDTLGEDDEEVIHWENIMSQRH